MHIDNKGLDILFINPSSSKGRGGRGVYFTPPMGIAYISAYLKQNNITTDFIDSNPEGITLDFPEPSSYQIENLKNILFKTVKHPPIFVGIGPCLTPNLINLIILSKAIKLIWPKVKIVVGGPHVSLDAPYAGNKLLNKCESIDIVVIGEGEKTLLDIITGYKETGQITSAPGMIYRVGSKFTDYSERPSINIHELPLPDRDLHMKYFSRYKVALRRNFIWTDDFDLKLLKSEPTIGVIIGSRGCPFLCSFCCSKKERRVRTAVDIFNEILVCESKYKFKFYIFYDDLFSTGSQKERERILEICNLINNNLDIFWSVELRADVICKLDTITLRLMYEAGCRIINIGIEKGYQSGLNYFSKGITIPQIKRAIDIIRKSGNFIINGTFIFGGNDETIKECYHTIKFSKELNIDFAAFYNLEIHPGTKIFLDAKKIKIINDDWEPYVNQDDYPVFMTNNISVRQLKNIRKFAYLNFYFRINYIFNRLLKIKSWIQLKIILLEYHHWVEHVVFGVR